MSLIVNRLIGFGAKRATSAAPPTTSYANSGGTGDRTASITVTSNQTDVQDSSWQQQVDGSFTDGSGADDFGGVSMVDGDYIRFDFGSGVKKYIDEFKIYVGGTTSDGAWQVQGSDTAGSGYTTYASFTWDAATKTVALTGVPAAGHRYWQIRKNGTSGSYSGVWRREFEFKIAAGA